MDKIGTETYINKLTARAKKYKRPNSEIINSIHLFIKLIGLMIVPVAILMFFTNLKAANIEWADIEARGGFIKILLSTNTFDSVIQKTFP